MRRSSTAAATLALGLCATFAHAEQTIYYPTTTQPAFSVAAPDDWELEPATEEGGFFNLNGPTGALLSFRTVEATKDDFSDAVNDTLEWVKQNYDKVKIDPATPAEENGLTGVQAVGTGFDKEDGHEVVFVMEWLRLKKSVAEVWYCVDKGDTAGHEAATRIMESFRAR